MLQQQRVLSSLPWAHDVDIVDAVDLSSEDEDVEDTLEQPLDVQTQFRYLI